MESKANQTKTMKQCLRTAAAIRRKLKGRIHSDSTELLREDRSGITSESLVDQAFSLEDLLSDVTKENRHSEVSLGAPIGKEIQRWMTQFRTDQEPFVCGMIDLDNFKKVNDTYGHQTGDFVLKEAAAFLKATLGPTDFVARYGGEEFVILLANPKLCQADETIADAISRLGALTFEYQANSLRFTFSCGLAECLPSENVESLIDRADKNMYKAKRRGKNQVFSGFNYPIGVSRVRSADANQ